MNDGRSWKIAEAGMNGEVTMNPKGLDRILKKRLGKDDRQFIPYSSISMISHNRKRIGVDEVTVQVGGNALVWKVKTDAEGFVNAVNVAIS